MLKIRLSRTGKKGQPSFRVVVQEHTSPIKGKFIEALGHYRPATDPKEFKINSERAKYWLSVGAQPSDSLAVLFKKEGIEGMEKFIAPRNKQRKKKKGVAEQDGAEAPTNQEASAKPEEAPKTPDEQPAETPVEEPKPEKTKPIKVIKVKNDESQPENPVLVRETPQSTDQASPPESGRVAYKENKPETPQPKEKPEEAPAEKPEEKQPNS